MLVRKALSLGVTTHRLGKNVTFYINEAASPVSGSQSPTSEQHRPLMLMFPWMGSRPQAVAKYFEIYFRTGFDVLVVETEAAVAQCLENGTEIISRLDGKILGQVQDFLWPRWSLDRGKTLLELLLSEPFDSRPLLVHAFSIGGFTFSQLLVHVCQDVQQYEALTQRIKGQVYDSLVVGSLETMARGLGKTVFPRWETAVKRLSLFYLRVFKHQTVDYINVAIDAFLNTPFTAPALFFFCENDPISEPRAVEEVIDHLRKRGMDVTAKNWADSTHAGHLKRHQQEYLTTLDVFLHSLRLAPLKAKIAQDDISSLMVLNETPSDSTVHIM